MGLTPPGFPTFLVASLAGGAGIAARLRFLSLPAPFAFALLAIGFVLLWVACVFRGL